VNEKLAKRYWPGEDSVGTRFHLDDGNCPLIEIVGLTKTGKQLGPPNRPRSFSIFRCHSIPARTTLLARSFGDPSDLVAPPREVVRGLDVNQQAYDVRTMEDFFQKREMAAYSIRRIAMTSSRAIGRVAIQMPSAAITVMQRTKAP